MSEAEQLAEVVASSERFCSVFARWVERPLVRETDRLVDDLGLSSLDLLYLLESIEELVSVQLENEVLDDIVTVGDVRSVLGSALSRSKARRPARPGSQ